MSGLPAIDRVPQRWHVPLLAFLTLLMTLPGLASIPAIDRDEARYVQASAQMAESGDWLNIRYQDEARNKKPAGAYWAQAAMIEVTGGAPVDARDRRIWAQRLPSVLAGVLSVLLTYCAAIPIIGRRGALIAGGLLSTSLIFVFEAHIAKTDALLLASTTAILCALSRLRAGQVRGMSWLFWIGLGASIMIKGPIGLALAVLSLAGLLIWERSLTWAKPLLRPMPIMAFALMWLPWAVAIWLATDGAFFAESLGRDFGGKLVSVQERHPGPPGYHLLLSLLTLWPASLFLAPAAVYTIVSIRKDRVSDESRGARLLLCWILPFWLLIELMPTKLPHYSLPLFPALAILMSGSMLGIASRSDLKVSRRIGSVLFILSTIALCTTVATASIHYGKDGKIIALLSGLLAFGLGAAASIWLWRGRAVRAATAAIASGIGLSVPTYGHTLPDLETLWIGQRAAEAAQGAPVLSPTFTEPSLVYHAGTGTRLDSHADWRDFASWQDAVLIIDRFDDTVHLSGIRAFADENGICLDASPGPAGLNYSRGDEVELVMIRQVSCA